MLERLRDYLQERRSLYLLYLLLVAIMAGTFYLHNLPWSGYRDGILFSLFLLVCYFLVSFYRYQDRWRQLQAIKKAGILPNGQVYLPKAQTKSEELYQAIIEKQTASLQENFEDNRQKQQELLDDFGLWLHQIKTPVAALDLLTQSQDVQPLQMRNELFKINEYLQMMLNYLRQQLDSQDLVFAKVELAPVVKTTVKKYASFFSQKDLQLVMENLDQTVTTDEKWLVFVLEQLLFNAIKYTKAGQIKITGGENQLQISDSGIGIRAEDLPRVFDKGYTGYNGRENQRASGLGLYLSKMVCDKLGITLSLTSKVGVGTVVTLTFPEAMLFS